MQRLLMQEERMSDITQRDIEELRRLAEDGRKLTLPGSQFFILWGLVIAAASFATYAVLRQWLDLPIHYIWIGTLALAWLGSFVLGFSMRHDPRGHVLVNRMTGAIWIANGIGITVVFIGLLASGAAGGNVMVPVAFAASGTAFAVMGALARLRWLYVAALGLWASAIAACFLLRTPEVALLSAGAALVFCVGPGMLLARHARRA
jgi:hypothetical protein